MRSGMRECSVALDVLMLCYYLFVEATTALHLGTENGQRLKIHKNNNISKLRKRNSAADHAWQHRERHIIVVI